MSEEARQKQKDFEHRMDFLMYIDYPDTFKEEYPDKEKDSDYFYVDQAPTLMDLRNYNGPRITSFFTPYGISGLDGWISKQIQGESEFTKDQLIRMIRRNPHLHNIIKTNLLSNIK